MNLEKQIALKGDKLALCNMSSDRDSDFVKHRRTDMTYNYI